MSGLSACATLAAEHTHESGEMREYQPARCYSISFLCREEGGAREEKSHRARNGELPIVIVMLTIGRWIEMTRARK